MTPAQKTEDVLKIVKDARRFYAQSEFVAIINIIWDALVLAESKSEEATKNGN